MKTSGLDVPKDSIFCTIYDGKTYSCVKEFSTTSVSIRSPGEYLQSEKVKKAAMESTSTYWVPIRDILYEMEFDTKAHHRLKLTACKQQLDLTEQQIKLYLDEMQKLCDEHFKEDIDNPTTIPGVSLISAMLIIAETGGNKGSYFMDRFQKPAVRKSRKKSVSSHWKKNISDNPACLK